ncbi:hypothetical protein [Pseudooceanicola algae]|nr:hypothetical protein [Pseudooceanicola algae]
MSAVFQDIPASIAHAMIKVNRDALFLLKNPKSETADDPFQVFENL